MARPSFTLHLWPLEVIIYGARYPPPPPHRSLPEEIRLDLWPSFTSARIKAALCSYCPGPHESNFIDHLESDGHPLHIKWRREKATGCGEMSTSCRDWMLESPAFPAAMKPLQLPLINMEISLPKGIAYKLSG